MKTRVSQPITIQPHEIVDYKFKQSKYEQLPRVPLRGLLIGPSGQGKTVAIFDVLLRLYRGCFARIYVWSPSIFLDATAARHRLRAEHDEG